MSWFWKRWCSVCFRRSHQRAPPRMPPSAGLRQRLQPSLWLHLLPDLRVGGGDSLLGPSSCSSLCSSQGAQPNPRFQLLPDGPRGAPASLRGRLLLSVQYGQLLQQPEQDCQVPQRSLRPKESYLHSWCWLTVSAKILPYLFGCQQSMSVWIFNCPILNNWSVFNRSFPPLLAEFIPLKKGLIKSGQNICICICKSLPNQPTNNSTTWILSCFVSLPAYVVLHFHFIACWYGLHRDKRHTHTHPSETYLTMLKRWSVKSSVIPAVMFAVVSLLRTAFLLFFT